MSTEQLNQVWIDTNFIIYYLRNNREFTQTVEKLVEAAEQGKLVLRVSPIVISECVFVLMGKQFGAKKTDVRDVLSSFINLPGVEAEEKSVIEEALSTFARKGIDFADAYIAAHAKANPPAKVVTMNLKDFVKLGVKAISLHDALNIVIVRDQADDHTE